MEEYDDYYDGITDKYYGLSNNKIYHPYIPAEKPHKEFAEYLKTLLGINLTIDQFSKMSEGEKVEFRRNFKLNQILDEKTN